MSSFRLLYRAHSGIQASAAAVTTLLVAHLTGHLPAVNKCIQSHTYLPPHERGLPLVQNTPTPTPPSRYLSTKTYPPTNNKKNNKLTSMSTAAILGCYCIGQSLEMEKHKIVNNHEGSSHLRMLLYCWYCQSPEMEEHMEHGRSWPCTDPGSNPL